MTAGTHTAPDDDRQVLGRRAERNSITTSRRRTRLVRAGLLALGVNDAVVGVWALLFPHSFFTDYPAGLGWVGVLGPFDEHLARDVGGLFLGFAVLLFTAMVNPSRPMAPSSVAEREGRG
jgi:hypothetical protein